jgi:catechol 2,3-dioxygenase-like lactoylglutathione lyase family enzyme
LVAQNRISAVVSSTDLERSREFYEQKVGLTLSPETVPNHLLFEGGDGTTLLVYGLPVAQSGRPHAGALLVRGRRRRRERARWARCGVRPSGVWRFQDGRPCAHDAGRQVRVVQRPGWQHHRALPACLAAPLRCRRRAAALTGRRSIAGRQGLETRIRLRGYSAPIVPLTRSARKVWRARPLHPRCQRRSARPRRACCGRDAGALSAPHRAPASVATRASRRRQRLFPLRAGSRSWSTLLPRLCEEQRRR